jgi:hypothetical protein
VSRDPSTVLRVEIATCVGCALVGAAFRFGGSTLQGMPIFLFGWSIGRIFHLGQMFLARRVGRRRQRGSR